MSWRYAIDQNSNGIRILKRSTSGMVYAFVRLLENPPAWGWQELPPGAEAEPIIHLFKGDEVICYGVKVIDFSPPTPEEEKKKKDQIQALSSAISTIGVLEGRIKSLKAFIVEMLMEE